MAIRTVHLLLLIVLVGVSVAVVVVPRPAATSGPIGSTRSAEQSRGSTRAAGGLLAHVPAGAQVVATIDVARLRQTDLGRALAGSGRELPGVGQLEAICGTDPTEEIESVAVVVPDAAPRGSYGDALAGDFGVVLLGNFVADRVADCAAAVVAERGGNPARSRVGSFTSVRDRKRPQGGEVAVRDGGPAILGGGGFLRELLDVAEGRFESASVAGPHGALRSSIGAEGAILGTWIRSTSRPSESDAPDLVPGLLNLAVRVDVAPDLDLRVLLGCSAGDGCRGVRETLERIRSGLADSSREHLGLDLARVRIEAEPQRITLSLTLSSREGRALIAGLERRIAPLLSAP